MKNAILLDSIQKLGPFYPNLLKVSVSIYFFSLKPLK